MSFPLSRSQSSSSSFFYAVLSGFVADEQIQDNVTFLDTNLLQPLPASTSLPSSLPSNRQPPSRTACCLSLASLSQRTCDRNLNQKQNILFASSSSHTLAHSICPVASCSLVEVIVCVIAGIIARLSLSTLLRKKKEKNNLGNILEG